MVTLIPTSITNKDMATQSLAMATTPCTATQPHTTALATLVSFLRGHLAHAGVAHHGVAHHGVAHHGVAHHGVAQHGAAHHLPAGYGAPQPFVGSGFRYGHGYGYGYGHISHH